MKGVEWAKWPLYQQNLDPGKKCPFVNICPRYLEAAYMMHPLFPPFVLIRILIVQLLR
jgi:hypothetical protein